MSLDELKAKREQIGRNTEITLSNMNKIADESIRVADVARNSKTILDDLDREFMLQTGLNGNDMKFLFAAVALQLSRIVLLNEITKIEKAGKGVKEKKLHDVQKKIFERFNTNDDQDALYYSSLSHILLTSGVPYDATGFFIEESKEKLLSKGADWDNQLDIYMLKKKINIFKGANHRFATLGHDPILGLIFGTGNIMTNTISTVGKKKIMGAIEIPKFQTNHVIYTSDFKNPRIGEYASTKIMLQETIDRTIKQPDVFVAALIKQIIHIGTDLYTPCGIQIPGANLILSKANTEKLTKYISSGDLIKAGFAVGFAELINLLIKTLHTLMYDPSGTVSRDLYSIRTRKIITYSNVIATGSNVIWVGGNMLAGNNNALKQLDLGGLILVIRKLTKDSEYIRKIKEEFVIGGFRKMIQGNELDLQKTTWDD